MSATDDLRIDWSLDGSYAGTGENVTSRVRSSDGIRVNFGRDQDRATSPTAAAQLSFTLDNRSRDYTPDNTSSPLYSSLAPGRPVRYQRTLSAVTYGLFYGVLDGYQVQPSRTDRSVAFDCVDGLARLSATTVSTQLYQGIRTGAAIGIVLAAAGWAGATDLDAGGTLIPYWWVESKDALTALQELVASEGSPAIAYIAPTTGAFTFRDRHHRLIDAPCLTSQATFRDTGAEPKFSDLTYDAGWAAVINDVTLNVDERRPDGALSAVWNSDETISLSAYQVADLEVQASELFLGAQTPVSGTDYTALSGSITASLSRTSGQSTVITLTAGPTGGRLQGIQLRAYAVPVVRTVKVKARDTESIRQNGSQGLASGQEPVWAGRYDAQAVATLAVQQRATRLPSVQITVRGHGDPARLLQCLSRGLSDRVTVIDSQTGLNRDFFIERITHEITESGLWHTTTFGLEAAPTAQTNVFRFDTSGHGFDQGMFGTGVDDPTTIFIFDSTSGHRFDEGVFAQ